MASSTTFTCDACGATGAGVSGDYEFHDPPLGWVWRWGGVSSGPHACSLSCWRKVDVAPDGRLYLADSHERSEQRPEAPSPVVIPPSQPPHPDVGSVVYFIQQGEDGPIKIGFSKNPEARLKQLQPSTPAPLRILRTIQGGRSREQSIHGRFQNDRLKGEWFRPTPELLEYIATAREIRQ